MSEVAEALRQQLQLVAQKRATAQIEEAALKEAIDKLAGKPKAKVGRPVKPRTLCSEGDGQPVLAKGLCRKHYYKARKAARSAQGGNNGAGPAPAA